MADDFPKRWLPVIPKDDEHEEALMLCIARRMESILVEEAQRIALYLLPYHLPKIKSFLRVAVVD